jgi:hypothetical protein
MRAITNIIESKTTLIDENIIIKALKGRKLKQDDITKLLQIMDSYSKAMSVTRIYLVEKKKDFV